MKPRSCEAGAVRIVDAVFGVPNPRPLPRTLFAGVAAVAAHAGLLVWAGLGGPSIGTWSHDLTSRVRAELGREEVLEAPKPEPRQPKEPDPPPPSREPPLARAPDTAPRARADAPPPPAQAGAIVAREPDPAGPVDLSDGFVTGAARTYAGGVTSTTGTSTKAVTRRDVVDVPPPVLQPAPKAARNAPPDKATPVAVLDPSWTCPWPREADAESVDEQVAVVRVTVRADGTVESATVVRDPGLGFGRAAVACAMRAHFAPARDEAGRPVHAQSAPIRVRFTR